MTKSAILKKAAEQFRCLSTGRKSGDWCGKPCPCPPCQAQLGVLAVAKGLEDCPCQSEDGLVQEWMSKVRAVSSRL